MTLTEELKSRLGEPRSNVRDTYHCGTTSGKDNQLFRLPARNGVNENAPVSVFIGADEFEVIKYDVGNKAKLTASISAAAFKHPTNNNDFIRVSLCKGTILVDGNIFIDIIDSATGLSVLITNSTLVALDTTLSEADIVTTIVNVLSPLVFSAYSLVHTPGNAYFEIVRVVTGAVGTFLFSAVNAGSSGVTFTNFNVSSGASQFNVLLASDGVSIMADAVPQTVLCLPNDAAYVIEAIVAQVTLKIPWVLRTDATSGFLIIENSLYANSTSGVTISIINPWDTHTTVDVEMSGCTVAGTVDVNVFYGSALLETVTIVTTGIETNDAVADLIVAKLTGAGQYTVSTALGVVHILADETGFDKNYLVTLENNFTDIAIIGTVSTAGSETLNVQVLESMLTLGTDSVTLSNYVAEDMVVQLNYTTGVLMVGDGVNGFVPESGLPVEVSYEELYCGFSDAQLHTCLINAYKDLLMKVPLTFSLDLVTEEFTFTDEAKERALLMATAIYNITKESISLGDYYYFKQQHRILDTTKTGVILISYINTALKADMQRALLAFRRRNQHAALVTLGTL